MGGVEREREKKEDEATKNGTMVKVEEHGDFKGNEKIAAQSKIRGFRQTDYNCGNTFC